MARGQYYDELLTHVLDSSRCVVVEALSDSILSRVYLFILTKHRKRATEDSIVMRSVDQIRDLLSYNV